MIGEELRHAVDVDAVLESVEIALCHWVLRDELPSKQEAAELARLIQSARRHLKVVVTS